MDPKEIFELIIKADERVKYSNEANMEQRKEAKEERVEERKEAKEERKDAKEERKEAKEERKGADHKDAKRPKGH